MTRPLGTLRETDFRPHLQSTFVMHLPSGQTLDLKLIQLEAHPHLPPIPERRRGFSALFRSEQPGHVPQGIYRLDHEQMGTLELFLVPIGPRDGGMCYEAVFN